mmetsp:Transcript_15647/g.21422  ORF Transcript_15647/g.21422 Transcript_15647/m.21422 type:complete len:361 (-) Transcript_15647:299-1381(-)|eukprot:CAMPEP_0185733832 /NCGR_PEP_ID=MMETSP1171-20130828/20654_1 /TAXON_ID=374046 /ORGANISM="Helicotheca tamensis, Strain CCMP826" /LENGTH=360 /DNA_ID=CAMNT_0028403657 /DNA_START=62 /DNA_END=1144 /DNA_ORIENTATION=+
MADTDDKSEDMTPEERLAWLRERGVQIETSEERHEKITTSTNEGDDIDTNDDYEEIAYVCIPHDDSKPMQQLSFRLPKKSLGKGDALSNHLKPCFGSSNGKDVDLSLLQDQATKQFGSSQTPTISQETLKSVAAQGSVETFALVHPVPSNKFVGVNVYLDEVGALKRLPLNKRASDLSVGAGFTPPPKFYGDVFLGRVSNKPVLKNISFHLGADTSPDAKWLKSAMMENLEYQTEMNAITGKKNELQPSNVGEDGIAKNEGFYSWTQTDEEVEVVVPVKSNDDGSDGGGGVSSKNVKVTFRPKTLKVCFGGKDILSLDFFARVDPDGCTWTLDKSGNGDGAKVVITCEKSDEVSWPRLTF